MLGGSHTASITGVGNTKYSKKADRSAGLLAIDAVMSAAKDAGIDPQEIDGLIPYPGHIGDDVLQAELDLKPRDIMTRAAFENAMVTVMALGGSTNAVLHLIAMARAVDVALDVVGMALQPANAEAEGDGEPPFLPIHVG